jgi:hypothetical protein
MVCVGQAFAFALIWNGGVAMINRIALVACIVAALAPVASADRATSLDHYNKGRRAYTAGKFEVAFDEFRLAYAEFAAPEYLQNAAQALRQLGRCRDAIDYFQRFLAAKPTAPSRAAVEKQIAALDAKCPVAQTPPAAPPAAQTPAPSSVVTPPPPAPSVAPAPPTAATPAGTTATGEPMAPAASVAIAKTAHLSEPPSKWSLSAETGLVFLSAGPVSTPPLGAIDLGAAYRPSALVQIHARAGLARLPYDDGGKGTAWLGSLEVGGDLTQSVLPRLELIGSVGIGATTLAGLGMGNPYTVADGAHSAITMLALRAAAGARIKLSPHVALRVTPFALSYSPRASGLASDISSVRTITTTIGLDVQL